LIQQKDSLAAPSNFFRDILFWGEDMQWDLLLVFRKAVLGDNWKWDIALQQYGYRPKVIVPLFQDPIADFTLNGLVRPAATHQFKDIRGHQHFMIYVRQCASMNGKGEDRWFGVHFQGSLAR
jgi:hypothetical protein